MKANAILPHLRRICASSAKVRLGDALDAAYQARVAPADSFVHLVGVPRPSPGKAAQFETVDFASIRAAVTAVSAARVAHFIYISVAHPAPVMKAYIAVRSRGEEMIRSAGLRATILRPWYVLGPGHRWPVLLKPVYGLMDLIPATRDGARRLGLVTLDQMVAAICGAVENPPANGVRIVEVPEITSSRT